MKLKKRKLNKAKIRAIFMCAVALFLCANEAHADPVSGTIAALTAAFATGATATTVAMAFIQTTFAIGAILKTAAIIGLSYLSTMLAGKPKPNFTISGVLQTGGDIFRSFIVGTFCTAGSLAYANTWTFEGQAPKAYLSQVIALSDLPVNGLNQVILNEIPCTYGAGVEVAQGYPLLEFRKSGVDYAWVKFYDGTQTTADPMLVSLFGTHPTRPYTASRKGIGVAYAILTTRLKPDDPSFQSFPKAKFVLEGIKLYDPRADDTAGGSGDQRWDDYDTYEWSDNPTLIKYNILRGLYWAGNWIYGPQSMPAARLVSASWFAGMNECDITILNSDDVEEPQYRCGAEISVADQPIEVIDALRLADNSKIAEIGGIFKIRVGAAASAVVSITDDDIVTTTEQSFDSIPSLGSLVNAVNATYPEPAENWSTKDAPGLYSEELEIEDGYRRLEANVSYGMIPYGDQVQRNMLYARNEARKFRRHAHTLPPEFFQYEPLDVLSWTSARNSYVDKLFEIVYMDDLANADQAVVLLEVDPADYTFDPCAYFPRSTTTLTKEDPDAYEIQDWAVAGTTLTGPNGRNRAAIALAWNPDIEDLAGVDYQVRLAATDEMVLDSGTTQWASGAILISENILSATTYEVRGRYRPANRMPSEWSDWLTVTTPNAQIVEADISNLAIATAALQDTAVTAAKIASGAITLAKFASGLTPVEILSALPSSGNFQGRQVLLTTDNKLYRYTGSAWTAAVATVDLSGQITTAQIVDAAITEVKVALNAITATKIADNAVTNAKIIADAVTSVKIATDAVTAAKIAAGEVGSSELAAGSVIAGKIAALTIVAADIAASTITGAKIAATTITASNIVSATITTTQIASDTIVAGNIAAGAITSSELAANSVIAGKIAALTIVAGDIAASTITGAKIAANTITAGNIAANTITASEIATDTLTAGTIAAGAISSSELAAGAVVAGKVAANAIGADEIAAGAIVTDKLAANAITAVKITAGSIETDKINGLAVTTGKIADNAVTNKDVETISYNSTDADISSWVTIESITITHEGGIAQVTADFYTDLGNSSNTTWPGVGARIQMDGSNITNEDMVNTKFASHQPSSASHTYNLQVMRGTAGEPTDSDDHDFHGFLQVVEFKK